MVSTVCKGLVKEEGKQPERNERKIVRVVKGYQRRKKTVKDIGYSPSNLLLHNRDETLPDCIHFVKFGMLTYCSKER